MLLIGLQAAKVVDPSKDELGRKIAGFHASMTQEELYEAGRGAWVFDPERARREKYALFVAEGLVQGAVEIEKIVHHKQGEGNRHSIVGRILGKGDPVFEKYVGKPTPAPIPRNPIRYFSETQECKCGCGEVTKNNKDFLPGHDLRALQARISRKFRSVAEFIDWFDEQFPPEK